MRKHLEDVAWFVSYIRPYRRLLLLGMGALSFGGGMALVYPYLVGRLIETATGRGITGWSRNELAAMLGFAVLAHASLAYRKVLWFSKMGDFGAADLRRELFGRLLRLPLEYFDKNRVGELTSRMTADVSLIRNSWVFTLPQVAGQSVIFIGGAVMLILTSATLSTYFLACMLVFVPVMIFFGGRVRALSGQAQGALADTNIVAGEALRFVSQVKACSMEDFECERYGSRIRCYVDTLILTAAARGLFHSSAFLILFGSITLVAWAAAAMLESGEMLVGDATQFALYSIFVGGVFSSFPETFSQLQQAAGAADRIRAVLSEPEENVDGSFPAAQRKGRLLGKVEVRELRFRYPLRRHVEVLRGVNLHADPGERVALVGPSGAGKSTFLALLLRFYRPDSGEILYDGFSGESWGTKYLRSQIAMVPQEILLFGGTIFENIAYGKSGATREEVETAARRANAHDFVKRLPEGYDTLVGERGTQLSGGQRQRISIARAILADPAILILDEATSSLDPQSEVLVKEALDELMRDRTSFVIAHRLSTVKDASRIYFLSGGSVVASGRHAELMRDSRRYREFFQRQEWSEVPQGGSDLPDVGVEESIES